MPTLLTALSRLSEQAPLTLKLYEPAERPRNDSEQLAALLLPSVPRTVHHELDPSLHGASVVIHLYRAGPVDYRAQQELKARQLGLVGQETQGFGGAASAMCNIAALREIAPIAHAQCPQALHIMITNPTGVMTAAAGALELNVVGLCELPYVLQKSCDAICGSATRLEYVGLNHFAWIAGALREDGSDCTDTLLAHAQKILENSRPANIPLPIPEQIVAFFEAIPSPYLAYYYRTADALAEQRDGPTRAEVVARLNDAARDAVSREDLAAAVAISEGRGGHMLGDALLAFFLAWTGICPRELVLCRPKSIYSLETASELPVKVTASCLEERQPSRALHPHAKAMLTTMQAYESILTRAGLDDDLDAFEQSLLTHPLVRDAQAAHELRLFHAKMTSRGRSVDVEYRR